MFRERPVEPIDYRFNEYRQNHVRLSEKTRVFIASWSRNIPKIKF
jgi:hypothetical protein